MKLMKVSPTCDKLGPAVVVTVYLQQSVLEKAWQIERQTALDRRPPS